MLMLKPAMTLIDGNRFLAVAIGVSLLVHGAVLAIRFIDPDGAAVRVADPRLDVVLVNAHSDTRPSEPDALAQANLDGGGANDHGRRTSPLPDTFIMHDGDAVDTARRHVDQLEEEQLRLLRSLANGEMAAMSITRDVHLSQPDNGASDAVSQRLRRMEAEIAQQVSDYQKRPKRQFFMPSTSESRFARYYEDWRMKVEKVGNEHYPEEARGRIYGDLRLTVAIRSDGTLVDAIVEQSSGSPVLDRAARRIVKLAAPFAPFPPEIARDTEVLEITRTWVFTNEKLTMHAPAQAPGASSSPPAADGAAALASTTAPPSGGGN